MSNPKVLFIMPTYLHARFLAQDIDAVLNQTFKDFKLVIVNDHSPDGSQEIIETFKDDRLIPLMPPVELGTAGKQINYAFEIAKQMGIDAPLELRIDGDNLVFPNFLEEMVKFMDANPDVDFGYSDYNYWILDGSDRMVQKANNHPAKDISKERLMGGMCVGPSVIWRKAAREKVGGYCEGWHEDWDFPLRILKSGGKLKYLDKVLVDYRFHVTNVQHRMASDQEKFCKEIRERFK